MDTRKRSVHRERRKHPRYRLSGRPYVVLGAFKDQTGNLIDISEGGLAFYYKEGEGRLSFQDRMDIFVLGGPVHLSDVQYTVVFDFPVKTSSFDKKKIRRCGIEFTGMRHEQRESLHDLILRHGAGQAA